MKNKCLSRAAAMPGVSFYGTAKIAINERNYKKTCFIFTLPNENIYDFILRYLFFYKFVFG